MNWILSQIGLIIQLAIVITMLSIGLQITSAEILSAISRKSLLAKALLANLIIIPVAAVLLTRLFAVPQWLAVGFLLVAAAPGAPLIPKLAEVAKADLPFSVGLMFTLAVLAIVATPLTAGFILPLDEGVAFNVPAVIKSLILLQLLPLLVGMATRRWLPAIQGVLVRPSILLANVALFAVISLIIIRDYETLFALPWTTIAAMLILSTGMLITGWLLGGPQTSTRKALALGTSAQSNGLALLITSSNFPGTAADIAVIAFGLLNIIINFTVAVYWNRRT